MVHEGVQYEPEFSSREVNRCLKELYELNLDIIAPLPDMLNLTTQLAYHYDITFYDAAYLTLAQELGLQFVTADEKLYNKVKKLSFVNLLNKISLP